MFRDITIQQNKNPERARFSVKKAIQDEVQRADLLRWCKEAEPVFEILPPLEEPKNVSLAALVAFGKSFSL